MPVDLLTVFLAGVITLATPCILPMLPVYFALLLGEGLDSVRPPGAEGDRETASGSGTTRAAEVTRWRLVGVASVFVAGFTLVFTLLGMAASRVGEALQSHRALLLVLGGLVIVAFGLKTLGVIRIRLLERTLQLARVRTGSRLVNAFAFGVVFALGWTPCVGPVLGSVLTYTAATTSSAATGALYLAAYSLGVGLPLLGVSLVGYRVVVHLRKLYRHLPRLERVIGGVMVGVGLLVAWPGLERMLISDVDVEPSGAAAVAATLGQPSERPRFVEFYAERCPVCERMKPRIEQLRRDCVGHRIDVVQIDVSDPANASVARRFDVRAVPTFVLLDERGDQRGQLFGERDVDELRAAAASLTLASCAGRAARSEWPSAEGLPACATVAPDDRSALAPAAEPEAVLCVSDRDSEAAPN